MPGKKIILTGLLALLISPVIFCQNNPYPVKLANGDFQLSRNMAANNPKVSNAANSIFNGRYHVLVQFHSFPGSALVKNLESKGVYLGQYLNNRTYEAVIDTNFNFQSAKEYSIQSVDVLPGSWKIDKVSFGFPAGTGKADRVFMLSLFHALDKSAAISRLAQLGIGFVPSKFTLPNIIVVQADRKKLNLLASLPFVSFIREVYIKNTAINYNDIATHGVSALQNPLGRDIRGQGMVVGLGDNSDINTHVDFTGKVITRMPWPPDYHGTHTGGTIAGGGFKNPKYQGMAPAAHLIDQWFSDVIVNAPVYLNDYNMPVTNNSYHSADLGCAGNQVYNLLSYYADDQAIALNQMVLNVFAAGNDGGYTCASYPNAYGTMKTGWQVAKNVLTVGAIDQATYQIASFSSRGPTLDGRIKPEIVANGFATISTYPYDNYATNYGTSMAAPVVTGVTALLQQSYRQHHGGATAQSSLVKGILCNAAEDLGNPGPDYTYGFGMLNAKKAVEVLENNQFFSGTLAASGSSESHTISVPAGARRLKAMLVWADPPGGINSATELVNDLDLTVTDPSLNNFLPFVLDPLNVVANATTGIDRINNMEQVVIDYPQPGTYSLNASAFGIATGSQKYYIVYQVDMNGVSVIYPSGGETLVPGETEYIRWQGNGAEFNDYTISYSSDNGSTWNSIGTAPFNAHSIAWVVPANAGNQYRVKVSRNSSSYSGTSDNAFTVLGQPVLTTSVPCEGFAQLSWANITGATSYDVFQLKGDSMALIGNTPSTNFLVSGLNSADSIWFAVAAVNNAVRGRRSMGQKVKPVSGACAVSQFDNNLKAVAILSPVSGREFTNTALPVNNSVKLQIRNLDNVPTSGSYDLFYSINGGPAVSASSATVIPALGNTVYSFTPTASFSSSGVYNITAWVKRTGDNFPTDDTARLTIRNLSNPILTLPFTDDFESASENTYGNSMGIDGDDHVDIATSSSRGRARTFVNTGLAYSGSKAITLDQYPFGALNSDSLTMTFNLSAYNLSKQLRADFEYKNHGQPDEPGNRVWLRGVDNALWTKAYDLNANQAALGQWKHGSININDVMDTLLINKTISSSFQLRFGQEAFTSANVVDPYFDQDDGYTFDDVKITEAINDVALLKLISPGVQACGLGPAIPVTIRLKNYSTGTRNNIALYYQVNGGVVITQNLPSLNAGATQDVSFASPVDMSAFQDYNIRAWIASPGDNYQSNDSVLNFSIHNSPVVNTYPYLEGFESTDGYWYAKGTNSSWQWGHPNKTLINKAANGLKAWVTSLDGNYNDNEQSYLYSPCFDLSALSQPMLSFSFISDLETDYDFAWIEYSTDEVNWQKLGSVGQGTNWYDYAANNSWNGDKDYWHVASIPLPVIAGTIKLRFVMRSDVGVSQEGLAIDDIHIFDAKSIYTGANQEISQTINGSGWSDITSSGNLVVSINPMGQNLGVTSFKVYNYGGQVRSSNGQYYLNRNFVVRPTTQPTGNVKIRLYFTDSEAEAMRNASGCGSCNNISDAYVLGLSKFSGDASVENGNLSDDQGGLFQFIPGQLVSIIPYNEGYYAEFELNSFSELWISEAAIQSPATCAGNNLQFNASQSGVVYQWQVDTGTGFQNIATGPVYAGYHSATLTINSVPGSYTGYIYRCVVDGVNGPSILLRFRNVWTGAVNNQWANAGNWSCGSVPGPYDDVYIPGNTSNQPVLSAGTSVRTLSIYPTGTLQTTNNASLILLGAD